MAGDVLVVLAAGRSSRMGAPKGLLDFHGRPWVAAQVARWGGPAIVVVPMPATGYPRIVLRFFAACHGSAPWRPFNEKTDRPSLAG